MFLGIEKFTGSHLGADSSPDPLYLNNLDSGHPTKFKCPRAFISASKFTVLSVKSMNPLDLNIKPGVNA